MKNERTIVKLAGIKGRVYVYLENDDIGDLFMKQAEKEGFVEVSGESVRLDSDSISLLFSVEDGGCFVHLAMSDGEGEIIRLDLLCGDEEQAKKIEKNFRYIQ